MLLAYASKIGNTPSGKKVKGMPLYHQWLIPFELRKEDEIHLEPICMESDIAGMRRFQDHPCQGNQDMARSKHP